MSALRELGSFLFLVGAGALAACSAGSGDDQPKSDAHGGSPSAGGTGPNPSSVCGASRIGAPRLRRLSRDELMSTLNDVFPAAQGNWTPALSADAVSEHGFDNDSSLLVVGKQTADELDRSADALAAAITGAPLAALLPCSQSTQDAACAGEFLSKYGRRLFRRAPTTDETARYLALFQQVQAVKDFASGIRYVTRALIQSPHAIYRREVGAGSGKSYQLSQHEIATELAYDFSGTTPSEALLAQADAGELASPAAREAAARALLQTEAGLRTVEKFFNAWLGYGRVSSVTKTSVPDFVMLRDQMALETRRFVGELVIARKAGLAELLTAPDTTPSTSLAAFYGFPAPPGEYAVTARPAGRGIGILAQGSLLSVLSGPNSSSPTRRGLLVMERLLCREKPVVPPDVPVLGEPQPGQLTTRQRYEQVHAQSGSCNGCHQAFDPIGFGFEHYDEAGRYRELDGGLPVDSASHVPFDGGELFRFVDLEELARGLAAQKLPYECATGFVSTYVFGAAEGCLGETKRGAFIDQQVGFVDYMASLATEPHFAERRLP